MTSFQKSALERVNYFYCSFKFCFLICILCLSVSAQSNQKEQIKNIDDYVKEIDTFIGKNESPHLVFADVSQSGKSKWQKFGSEKALEKFRETIEIYTISYNWQKNGEIIASNFTLFSASGDWVKYVNLYFREDGTISKAEAQLNTFYGNFSLIQSTYFNQNGTIIKNSSQYLDLETKKPKKPTEDDILNNGDTIKNLYYKKTSDLPYNHLLHKNK